MQLDDLEAAVYDALIEVIEAIEDETGPVSFSLVAEETPMGPPLLLIDWLYADEDDLAASEGGAQEALKEKTSDAIRRVVGDTPYALTLTFQVDDEDDEEEDEDDLGADEEDEAKAPDPA